MSGVRLYQRAARQPGAMTGRPCALGVVEGASFGIDSNSYSYTCIIDGDKRAACTSFQSHHTAITAAAVAAAQCQASAVSGAGGARSGVRLRGGMRTLSAAAAAHEENNVNPVPKLKK